MRSTFAHPIGWTISCGFAIEDSPALFRWPLGLRGESSGSADIDPPQRSTPRRRNHLGLSEFKVLLEFLWVNSGLWIAGELESREELPELRSTILGQMTSTSLIWIRTSEVNRDRPDPRHHHLHRRSLRRTRAVHLSRATLPGVRFHLAGSSEWLAGAGRTARHHIPSPAN